MSKEHQFVITNPELCIGCKACEKACVKEGINRGKLGISRIKVFKVEKTGSTNQCRQCDDAPCAAVCPSGALQNLGDFVHINEHLCVGCALCTSACPYGAISLGCTGVLNVENDKSNFSQPGFPNIAVKCDICDGRDEGSACVEACPKGALVMLDFKNSHKFGKKLKDTKNMENFIHAITGKKVDLSELAVQEKPKPAPSQTANESENLPKKEEIKKDSSEKNKDTQEPANPKKTGGK